MKIALFTDTYKPLLNGVTFALKWLSDDLRSMGHEVYIFAPDHINADYNEEYVFRFPSIQPPGIAYRFPLSVPFHPLIKKHFKSIRFDIVHTHTPFMVGLAGKRWGKTIGVPVVSTYHTLYDQYLHYVPFFNKSYLYRRLYSHLRTYYNGCNAVITVSKAARQSLIDFGVNKSIHIIPTGMPQSPELDKLEQRKLLNVPDNVFQLLYVGRIAPEKNLELLLDSIKEVARDFPQIRLWIVGGGPSLDEVKQQSIEMGLADIVQFVGFVPRETVNRYYSAADLFVFPSSSETQGLVIGEAQIYGLPCVVVEGGGASEAVNNVESAIVVKPKVYDFASAIRLLITDPALMKQFSINAKRYWKDKTSKATAQQVLQVYSELISDKSLDQSPIGV